MPQPANKMNYETIELNRARSELSNLNSIPLQQKREAKQEFFEHLVFCPDLVAVKIEWLLNGSYGFGYQAIAKTYFNRSKRFNIRANLLQLIACAEYLCPATQANQAYKMLCSEQQDEINDLIEIEVQHYKSKQKTHATKGK